MGFKKTKMAVASLMVVALAACSTNKNVDNTVGTRNVSTGDMPPTLTARNVNTGDVNRDRTGLMNDRVHNWADNRYMTTGERDWNNARTNRNNNRNMTVNDLNGTNPDFFGNNYNGMGNGSWVNHQNPGIGTGNTTTEIQPSNNGFITIAHNSFSTDTPSHMFPHTKKIQQGNYFYYQFQPAGTDQNTSFRQGRQYGAVTPGQTQTTPNWANPANPAAPKTTVPRTATPNTTAPTKQTTPARTTPPAQSTAGISQMAQQVIDLTNVERKKNGLPPLKADASLSRVAQTKSDDMEAKHYFSHTSPTYGSPFDMMRDFGVTYKSAGENIAMGQRTAQEVVTAWMNSEGHRKNILSPNFTNIGVGFTSKGNYWSQMFIGK